MVNTQLYHSGVLGMHWGVRRTSVQPTRGTPGSKKQKTSNDDDANNDIKVTSSTSGKKHIKDMSDAELKDVIGRLELEKRYSDLSKVESKATSSKGKEFVMDVLDKSGKNIATQLATYAFGAAVNKVVGTEIVNPKKGQKDK